MDAMEQVDIVDENDEVVGSVSKQEAHERGLLHHCVIAEIVDKDGNWTLVQQASDRQDAGQFVSPVGGHVQAGESLEDALRREAEEEAGLTDITFRYVDKTIYNREVIGRKENHYFIVYEIFSDDPLTLNHESVAYEKFSMEQLREELAAHPQKFGAAFHFLIDFAFPDLRE
jgi:8-oxo-dGTP pyrophosphatase MutT (NUDIX family)